MIKIGPSKEGIKNEVCIENVKSSEDVDHVLTYLVATAKKLKDGEHHTLMVGAGLRKDARNKLRAFLLKTQGHTGMMRKFKIVEEESI